MRKPFPTLARDDLSGRVRQELTDQLFQGWIPLLVMTTAFLPLGSMVVREARDRALTGLFGLCCIALVARAATLLAYRLGRNGEPAGRRSRWRWEAAFAASFCLFSGALGLFTARAFALDLRPTDAFIIALIFGYGAGVVARVSIKPWIALTSLALAVAPPSAALALSGHLPHQVVAFVICVFGIGSTETIRYIARTAMTNSMLRHHLLAVAQHDALTGLANRRLLEERLQTALDQDPGRAVAVHYLDLDCFKPVNDQHGHAIGDALLRAVAARLESLTGPTDLVARLGGDEFVVVQANCSRPHEAELLARRMVRALSMPFDIAGRDIRIGASLGVAIAPRDGHDPKSLIGAADAALYRAKMRGRNGFEFAETRDRALAS